MNKALSYGFFIRGVIISDECILRTSVSGRPYEGRSPLHVEFSSHVGLFSPCVLKRVVPTQRRGEEKREKKRETAKDFCQNGIFAEKRNGRNDECVREPILVVVVAACRSFLLRHLCHFFFFSDDRIYLIRRTPKQVSWDETFYGSIKWNHSRCR